MLSMVMRRNSWTMPRGCCRICRNSLRLTGLRRNCASMRWRECQMARSVRADMPISSGCCCITRKARSSSVGLRSKPSSRTMSSRSRRLRKSSSIRRASLSGRGNSRSSMFCTRMTLSWVTRRAAQ
ncbi:Uncharacterised protein [Bordetella pertussis]|nr:Uncharacterised protein [Bordetella pertussis]